MVCQSWNWDLATKTPESMDPEHGREQMLPPCFQVVAGFWGRQVEPQMAKETDFALLPPSPVGIVGIICFFSPSNITSD